MKRLAAAVVLLISCGPNWTECPDCTAGGTGAPGSGTAGPTVVLVDNDVTVVVDVDVSVEVGEEDGPGACCQSPDAGSKADAGAPKADAGSKADAGCGCHKVCRKHKTVHEGHRGSGCKDKKDRKNHKWVCTETVLVCGGK